MEKKDLTFTFDPNDLGSMCELMDKYGDSDTMFMGVNTEFEETEISIFPDTMTAEATVLPQGVKSGVSGLFPVPQLRIGEPAEGLVRALVNADIRHAVSAEVDFAVAPPVNDFAVDKLGLAAAVVAINFPHGCHSSLYLAICSGVSVSMPSSWHSEMIPSRKTLISLVEYSLVPLMAR